MEVEDGDARIMNLWVFRLHSTSLHFVAFPMQLLASLLALPGPLFPCPLLPPSRFLRKLPCAALPCQREEGFRVPVFLFLLCEQTEKKAGIERTREHESTRARERTRTLSRALPISLLPFLSHSPTLSLSLSPTLPLSSSPRLLDHLLLPHRHLHRPFLRLPAQVRRRVFHRRRLREQRLRVRVGRDCRGFRGWEPRGGP